MPGVEKIRKKVMVCATCDLWKGEIRNPSNDRLYVLYESFQRGLCTGPIKTGKSMTPMNKCRAWRLWKKMNKPRVDNETVFGREEDLTKIGEEPDEKKLESFERETDLGSPQSR